MTKVAILRDGPDAGKVTYRAVGGNAQAAGRTAGEAVDALTARLPEDQGGTLIIVRDLQPDRFFSASQRHRLEEMMDRWRTLRDSGGDLPSDEQVELQGLIDAEVEASSLRAEEAWRELSR